jgi:hypothetical protein
MHGEVIYRLAATHLQQVREIMNKNAVSSHSKILTAFNSLNPHSLACNQKVTCRVLLICRGWKSNLQFWRYSYRGGDDQKSIIKRADNNIYRAKESG